MSTEITGLGRRLACMLYEGLVVFAILLIGFLMPQIVFSGFGLVASAQFLWLHVVALLMFYFVWCWLHGGQTLPMKTWKMRVVDQNGQPLRLAQAILRYLAAWPSILFLGLGIFWAVFDRDKQFLHDRIAGSRIIAAPPPQA